MVNAIEAFKLGPVFTQLLGQILQHGDAHIATDGEENNISKMCSGVAIFLHNMLKAFYEGVAGCNNIADNQRAAINNAQLFIFNI